MRTVVPLVLAMFLATAVPAVSIAKPIEPGPASTPAAVQTCHQPSAIGDGTARGSHRVPCDPAGAADLPARPASVATLHGETAGIAWEPIALVIAGAALLAAFVVARRRTAIPS